MRLVVEHPANKSRIKMAPAEKTRRMVFPSGTCGFNLMAIARYLSRVSSRSISTTISESAERRREPQPHQDADRAPKLRIAPGIEPRLQHEQAAQRKEHQ